MEKKNLDIFETTKSNLFVNTKKQQDKDNFFLFDDKKKIKTFNSKPSESTRRLNDYDFNLLKEDAYKDVSDDIFKLEYKISKTEEEIKSINTQILAAEDIQDTDTIEILKNRKQLLEDDYEALVEMYNDKSLSAKITDSFSSLLTDGMKTKINDIQLQISKYTNVFISKLPKRFSKILELKKSLSKPSSVKL